MKEKVCTKYDPPCTDSGQLYIKDFILKNSINKNIDYIDENHLHFKNLSLNNFLEHLQSNKNVRKELLENEQSSFPSKSYKNSSFLNDPCKGTLLKQQSIIPNNKQNIKSTERAQPNLTSDKAQWKELRNFYPLSEKDINLLNSRANREFSNNFVNQLLLKLYIKYPEKRFKNRFTFLSYSKNH